jgi:hypothetical protein
VSNLEKRLEEICDCCGYPTIEKLLKFNGERLAVTACLNPKCDYFDWEISKKLLDMKEEDIEITETDLFQGMSEWARDQAKKIKQEFLSRQPIKIQPKATRTDVERFLANLKLAFATRRTYRNLLLRFVEWLEKEERF